jgi:DNA-binding Lrp family transcriptional regulator
MSSPRWHHTWENAAHGRNATLIQIIEIIDDQSPETKDALAAEVGVSDKYLSELLQELKNEGLVRKAYVVDHETVYGNAESISPFYDDGADPAPSAAQGDHEGGVDALANFEPKDTILDLLGRLNDVTVDQYAAAHEAFTGVDPEQSASALESLANERYDAVLSELKSHTLTTDWPGNRVASDLATIATNLEIVGDRACFIADVVGDRDAETAGVVTERVEDIFEAGESINGYLESILFESDVAAYEQLLREEETVHRDLNELFELITAYEPAVYGHLVSVTRALERAIYYWVHSAELAVRLHSGLNPDHVMT